MTLPFGIMASSREVSSGPPPTYTTIWSSNDFTSADWTIVDGTDVVTAAVTTDPSSTSASQLVCSTDNTAHSLRTEPGNGGYSLINGTKYAFSIELKAKGVTQYVTLGASPASDPPIQAGAWAMFDLVNGTIFYQNAHRNCSITSLGNNWFTLLLPFTADGDGTWAANLYVEIYSGQDWAFAGDGTMGYYMCNAKLMTVT